jgi:hypothetical protein
MSHSAQQLVRNQILIREVNERLLETLGSFEGVIDFLCECSNDACIETLLLSQPEYESVRAHANLFVVLSGHERTDVDRVVDQGDGYVLVEKIVAVDEVIAADPRTRGRK